MDSIALWHNQDPINSLVENASGSDILHSIICGRLLMQNRAMYYRELLKIKSELAEICEEKRPDGEGRVLGNKQRSIVPLRKVNLAVHALPALKGHLWNQYLMPDELVAIDIAV